MPNPVLSEVATRLRAGETVTVSTLVRLTFTNETVRLWDGIGPITVAGETYDGAGELLNIGEIDQTRGGTTSSFTITVSQLDAEAGPLAASAEAEWKYRPARIMQLFRHVGGIIGVRTVRTGTMQSLKRSRDSSEKVSLAVTCEDLFTDRRRPRFALMSDADQRRRYPGDKGLEYQPSAAEKDITWPKF